MDGSAGIVRSGLPEVRNGMIMLSNRSATRRYLFGDVALAAFLLAQALDGVLTYLGVSLYGPQAEGNPLIGWLMATIGEGAGLAAAKVTAGSLGIALHLSNVHMAVALLTLFYVAVAIVPWLTILFF
jgi:hypothetical protein